MRKPIIAGNWKMNMTVSQAKELIDGLKPLVKDAEIDVVVCPNFTCLTSVVEWTKGTNIKVGAQNMFYEEKGAYTGETAPDMLTDIGVEYVILGHSERRTYFGDTDETVNKKTVAALAHGLKPIVCVGETLEEREAGKAAEVVSRQTTEGLKGVAVSEIENIVIAYEPVWAIGTGRTATAQDANETIAVIRKTLGDIFGAEAADKMRIQYGGSMNAKNAAELMAQPEIDGGLIGGAALKPVDFSKIVLFDK